MTPYEKHQIKKAKAEHWLSKKNHAPELREKTDETVSQILKVLPPWGSMRLSGYFGSIPITTVTTK